MIKIKMAEIPPLFQKFVYDKTTGIHKLLISPIPLPGYKRLGMLKEGEDQ